MIGLHAQTRRRGELKAEKLCEMDALKGQALTIQNIRKAVRCAASGVYESAH